MITYTKPRLAHINIIYYYVTWFQGFRGGRVTAPGPHYQNKSPGGPFS